ncbi:MAG: hypothetical protein AAF447_10720 [Myxococcota bacterium]
MSPFPVAFALLMVVVAGCPRVASDPPFTSAPSCATDADCRSLLDAGCNDVFACVVGRCELVPSRVRRCQE